MCESRSEKVAKAYAKETKRWKAYQQNRILSSMKRRLEKGGYDPDEWDLTLGIYSCPHGHFVNQEDECPHGCEVPENDETIDFGETFSKKDEKTNKTPSFKQKRIESFEQEKVIA